ncbi:MAG: SRPBCC domain-containing protein [Marinicaulis sp.]|nr:SRPBCC domain-containing protein [Marinicaulis sp.]
MTQTPEFVLDRVFDAPRDFVWRAWTDPELVSRWYGPGVETIIHEYTLKTGGVWKNEMRFGDKGMFSIMEFEEVTPPEKMVWRHSSSDADWNVVSNSMMPEWPKTLLTTVTFTEEHGKTKVRLSQVPLNATKEEEAAFAATMANMDGGWSKGYAIIDEILAEMK